ncbi:hypothetical protein J4219_06090 [Candidatus Woesearchaeota archaeon]|nr:hypothetical protein [Candidatus Woesearchaeota archaeon]
MVKPMKRRLAAHEEFEIMKLVLDKFLWIGTFLMGFGIYSALAYDVVDGAWYVGTGALVMVLFAWFIVKEFELVR